MEEPEVVTVTIGAKRYEELLHSENKLMALEGAGVDNWEGYGDAMQALEEMEG